VPGVTFSALDAIYELWFDDARTTAQAALADAGWRERLHTGIEPLATPSATLILAAREAVQFDRGAGAVKFIAFPKRNARFATQAEWIRYWAQVHGPLAHGIPQFTRYYSRYVHNYTVPCEHASGGLAPDCDGIVEEWVASVDAFASCLAEPCYRDIVAPDERHFLDLEATRLVLATERGLQPRATSLVRNDRDDAREAGARPIDLRREGGDGEAVRAADRVEVRELLDLAVGARDAGEVRWPDEASVAGAAEVLGHRRERPVEAERVDADHLDALLDEP
jgi:hypothetical protein